MNDNRLEDSDGRADEAGFTLVELLVALALFSLLATLLFQNVHFGLQAWRSGSTSAEQLQRDLAVQDLLRSTIDRLYPMAVMDGGGRPIIEFEGTKESVSFLGSAPRVVGEGGLFRFKIFSERGNDGTDLVMAAMPELAPSGDLSSATKTILLADVERAEFSYFDAGVAAQRVQWKDSWSKRSDMPSLIRVRVTFRSGDARSWPELVIAPRVQADVGCVYDPISMRCSGR